MKLQILELPGVLETVGNVERSTAQYALIASEVALADVELAGKALERIRESAPDIAWTLATNEKVELEQQ